ncbi:MAG: helix-turn-helix transcriptional regulator [Chloroflexi bacterium]|nr:helix-turn-helix transcriptional regulator [Chloroflexota bacterium]
MDPAELGIQIKQAREKRGLSQEQLADLISRDQRAVSEYENGKRRIAVTEVPKLARALGVPILYFFSGDLQPDDDDRLLLDHFHRLKRRQDRETALEVMRVLSAGLSDDRGGSTADP